MSPSARMPGTNGHALDRLIGNDQLHCGHVGMKLEACFAWPEGAATSCEESMLTIALPPLAIHLCAKVGTGCRLHICPDPLVGKEADCTAPARSPNRTPTEQGKVGEERDNCKTGRER